MPRQKRNPTPEQDLPDVQQNVQPVEKKKSNESSRLVKGSEESKARMAELRNIKAQKRAQK